MSPRRMSHTLRALAWLLRYPDNEMRAVLPELGSALRTERALDAARLHELDVLIERLSSTTALRVETEYVELFDRGRRTALHLFEHVHGDSRDRGQAMVDLRKVYARSGFQLAGNELPDFVPAL